MLELLVVVSLLGIFAAGAAVRLGPGTIWNIDAQADARRLALSLQQARRMAIKTGNDHYVLITPNAVAPEGFQVYEWNGTTGVAVDEYQAFGEHLTVTAGGVSTFFDFEGEASGVTSYTIAGPDRTFQVAISPATGAVRVSEP